MKFFKPEDAFMDRASKTITMLATVGTLGFGVYAYYNTIHPVFEKEKELQSLRSEKLTLNAENEQLSADNIALKAEFKASKDHLSLLNEKLSTTNTVIEEKQKLLDKMNKDLTHAKKQTILSKLDIIREKLLNKSIYELSVKRNNNFNVIDYSRTLLPKDTNKISSSEKEAFDFFNEYIDEHNGKNIKSIDDIIKYAILLPYAFKVKQNMLNDND